MKAKKKIEKNNLENKELISKLSKFYATTKLKDDVKTPREKKDDNYKIQVVDGNEPAQSNQVIPSINTYSKDIIIKKLRGVEK
tara:strand:- start:526 stop:774 length:249 start_codon:yes stop_codon:yes gene_type:complete